MSTTEIVNGLKELPESERSSFVRRVLQTLYPGCDKLISRIMRRLDHPEIPQDFWEAAEDVEDGKSIEMNDEQFQRPPL